MKKLVLLAAFVFAAISSAFATPLTVDSFYTTPAHPCIGQVVTMHHHCIGTGVLSLQVMKYHSGVTDTLIFAPNGTFTFIMDTSYIVFRAVPVSFMSAGPPRYDTVTAGVCTPSIDSFTQSSTSGCVDDTAVHFFWHAIGTLTGHLTINGVATAVSNAGTWSGVLPVGTNTVTYTAYDSTDSASSTLTYVKYSFHCDTATISGFTATGVVGCIGTDTVHGTLLASGYTYQIVHLGAYADTLAPGDTTFALPIFGSHDSCWAEAVSLWNVVTIPGFVVYGYHCDSLDLHYATFPDTAGCFGDSMLLSYSVTGTVSSLTLHLHGGVVVPLNPLGSSYMYHFTSVTDTPRVVAVGPWNSQTIVCHVIRAYHCDSINLGYCVHSDTVACIGTSGTTFSYSVINATVIRLHSTVTGVTLMPLVGPWTYTATAVHDSLWVEFIGTYDTVHTAGFILHGYHCDTPHFTGVTYYAIGGCIGAGGIVFAYSTTNATSVYMLQSITTPVLLSATSGTYMLPIMAATDTVRLMCVHGTDTAYSVPQVIGGWYCDSVHASVAVVTSIVNCVGDSISLVIADTNAFSIVIHTSYGDIHPTFLSGTQRVWLPYTINTYSVVFNGPHDTLTINVIGTAVHCDSAHVLYCVAAALGHCIGHDSITVSWSTTGTLTSLVLHNSLGGVVTLPSVSGSGSMTFPVITSAESFWVTGTSLWNSNTAYSATVYGVVCPDSVVLDSFYITPLSGCINHDSITVHFGQHNATSFTLQSASGLVVGLPMYGTIRLPITSASESYWVVAGNSVNIIVVYAPIVLGYVCDTLNPQVHIPDTVCMNAPVPISWHTSDTATTVLYTTFGIFYPASSDTSFVLPAVLVPGCDTITMVFTTSYASDTARRIIHAMDCRVDTNVGVEEVITTTGFQAYPNPVNEQMHLVSNSGAIGDVIVTDIVGREVVHILVQDKTATIPTGDWPLGTYMIRTKYGIIKVTKQ